MKKQLSKMLVVIKTLAEINKSKAGFTSEESRLLYKAAENVAAVGITVSLRFGEAEENEDD